MLPTAYHVPAALILLVGGLLACFAGYRLFRLVLAIYGFILGAVFAVALTSPHGLLWMAIVAVLGGLIGALLLRLGYFLAVALLGGGLGVAVAHAIWLQQGWGAPRVWPLLGFAIAGAILALIFQRYVIVIGTGFGGAWTAVMGAAAMAGDPAASRLTDGTATWFVHPFAPPLTRPWVTLAWVLLGVAGTVVQLRAGVKRHPSGS